MKRGTMPRQDEVVDILQRLAERTLEEREAAPNGPYREALEHRFDVLAERWDALRSVWKSPAATPGRAFVFDLPGDVWAEVQRERERDYGQE